MAEFLVELYVSGADGAAVERGAERTRLVAEELTRQGRPVRYLRLIFVPEDETCFYLYEAASAAAVCDALRRSAVPFERVAEVASGRNRERRRSHRRQQARAEGGFTT